MTLLLLLGTGFGSVPVGLTLEQRSIGFTPEIRGIIYTPEERSTALPFEIRNINLTPETRGVIYTPETTTALNGITRKTVFNLAADRGLQIVEKRLTRDEVYISDEAFFTGTAAEVTPIAELDNRAIGSGVRGPITEQLQGDYFDLVHGRNEKYLDLLTYVK